MRSFQLPGRSPVFAENGMCATSHPLAAKVAVDILQSGGNAVDAAIAGSMVLNVCEPQMTGLGGDLFALIKPPGDERIMGLNASGRAPAAFDAAPLRAEGHAAIPDGHVAAITLPGAVDGFCRLSEDFGLKGLDEVLAPAIHYAEAGVPVAPRVARDWQVAADRLQGAGRLFFLGEGGSVPAAGTIFRHPMLGEVMRAIADKGRAGFYEGQVAEDMVATLRAAGGAHSLDDFAAVASDDTEPVAGRYRGVDLLEHPPNGQGATAILILHILSQFDMAVMDPAGAERAHLLLEASKLAYDARNRFLADPDHTQRLDRLLDPGTGRDLAALIDPKRAMPNPAAASEQVHRDTVYITVVDRDRMAVSLIYSIFHSFGSGLASDRFGILFHNRGCGFTLQAGHPNEAAAGKRPLHTIIPAMTRRGGRFDTSFGVMGGQYQASGHAQFVSSLEDFGMDLQAAIDAPRLSLEAGEGRQVVAEAGHAPDVLQRLGDLGHDIQPAPVGIGGAQAIRLDHDRGVLEGGSDPRKDGIAVGY